MALLEDWGKIATPGHLVIGLGAALLAPVLAPAAVSVLRPAAKAVLRTAITVYRETMEPLGTALSDLVVEAQLERAADQAPGTATSEPRPLRRRAH